MVKLFRSKYRIKSARLDGWDYSQDAAYSVTICTKDKKHFFGEIRNKEMRLSPIGEIVTKEWVKTEKLRKNIKLDKWVVMPNHIHGIIIIDNWSVDGVCRDVARNVSTTKNKFSKISPKPNSLPAIIRSFKSAVTKQAREIYPNLNQLWQPRYYDHIIHTEKEYGDTQDYILNNVKNWEKDKENKNKIR